MMSVRAARWLGAVFRLGRIDPGVRCEAGSATGGGEIGPPRFCKGLQIRKIADRHGLPAVVSTHAANHHEVPPVQRGFDCQEIKAKPQNLIGDRVCDRDEPRITGTGRNTRRRTDIVCAGTSTGGTLCDSFPGFSGNVGSFG